MSDCGQVVATTLWASIGSGMDSADYNEVRLPLEGNRNQGSGRRKSVFDQRAEETIRQLLASAGDDTGDGGSLRSGDGNDAGGGGQVAVDLAAAMAAMAASGDDGSRPAPSAVRHHAKSAQWSKGRRHLHLLQLRSLPEHLPAGKRRMSSSRPLFRAFQPPSDQRIPRSVRHWTDQCQTNAVRGRPQPLQAAGPSGDEDSEVELDKSNVLLIGSTGTGKTLLARTLARIRMSLRHRRRRH